MIPILILLPVYILLMVLGGSILFVFIVFGASLLYRRSLMHKQIDDLLELIAKENKIINYQLHKVRDKAYDIYFETLTHIYYIKILPNYNNNELYIKDRNHFYLINKVKDLETKKELKLKEFINFKLESNPKKETSKLLLVYPNAKAIIHYKNQCELNFVYDDMEIYGTRVIAYENLYNRHNIIEGR